MDTREFREQAHQLVDWMADFLENIESCPVRARVAPGEILDQLPGSAPAQGEPFADIMDDFQKIIMPGMTHWQHPSFFAYFPANSSPPSVLAEMLTATLGAQCMIWQTSPAAAELEECMMNWLREMTGLPAEWEGVIQDTASTATLSAILSARERFSGYETNRRGLRDHPQFIIYGSAQTHSSIEKAVKIAGLGSEQLRLVAVDERYAMRPEALEAAITADRDEGRQPLCVIATLGTTGSTAIDPLRAIGEICRRYSIWLHVDAAFAGSAMILPEMRHHIDGVDMADSYVFNPHKWLFTNFDCSAYFVKDREPLLRTFEILPEYLKTTEKQAVNNYRDWGIPLGRRFRALKLWFVIRTYGVAGLQERLRHHIRLAQWLAEQVDGDPHFQRLAPVPFNLVCFRYRPPGLQNPAELDKLNARLLEHVNRGGRMFITHTRLNGVYTIRMVIGQTAVEHRHVEAAWQEIRTAAAQLG